MIKKSQFIQALRCWDVSLVNFTIVDPTQPAQPDVILANVYDWFRPDATSLGLTWDPLVLDTLNTSQNMDVSLFGYRETGDTVCTH